MRIRTRIGEQARARGLTGAEVARRLGWYRSNISAMDAGDRAVSMRALAKVAALLSCSPGDLLQVCGEAREQPILRSTRLDQRLHQRDRGATDGVEKGWVHAAQLAWLRHYRAKARRR